MSTGVWGLKRFERKYSNGDEEEEEEEEGRARESTR